MEFLARFINEAMGFEVRPSHHAISRQVAGCLIIFYTKNKPRGMIYWHAANFVVLNRIDRDASREAIFESFVNETYFGRGAYGVNAAAQTFYRKSLSELSVDEAALLAAFVEKPSAYLKHQDSAYELRNDILDKMAKFGFMDGREIKTAKERPLTLMGAASH